MIPISESEVLHDCGDVYIDAVEEDGAGSEEVQELKSHTNETMYSNCIAPQQCPFQSPCNHNMDEGGWTVSWTFLYMKFTLTT